MSRKYQKAEPTGHTILVVDDSPDILESTRRLMEAEGHRVLTAPEGKTALEILEKESVHLVLVDYFMPGMTGEEVVRQVRERDELVQIILVTGYAGEKPARVMMKSLDIQGYHDKSEGAERLLLWVDAALKTYQHAAAMAKHRRGLRFILDVAPEMHRMQPLDELLQGLLWHMEGLLGAENTFLATVTRDFPPPRPVDGRRVDGFVAAPDSAMQAEVNLEIRYGTGKFRPGVGLDALAEPDRTRVEHAIRAREVRMEDGISVVPLYLDGNILGVIYLDRHTRSSRDQELLRVFGNQAAAAIRNVLLFEAATIDPMTGTHVRSFLMRHLRQAVKRSHRRRRPLTVMMIDVDRFKQINDRYGHAAGDDALQRVAQLLVEGVRDTDTVGRYGGDEFIILLPDTPVDGARIAGERILAAASRLTLEVEGDSLPIRISIGIGSLPDPPAEPKFGAADVEALAKALIHTADRALYVAKRDRGETAPRMAAEELTLAPS